MVDIIWLKFVMGDYYVEILQPIARMNNGGLDVDIPAAFGVYFFMSLALEFFILRHSMPRFTKIFQSALLGICMYGVFDFTNYAILKDYPAPMLYIDVLWGGVLFSIVAYVRCLIKPKRLFS